MHQIVPHEGLSKLTAITDWLIDDPNLLLVDTVSEADADIRFNVAPVDGPITNVSALTELFLDILPQFEPIDSQTPNYILDGDVTVLRTGWLLYVETVRRVPHKKCPDTVIDETVSLEPFRRFLSVHLFPDTVTALYPTATGIIGPNRLASIRMSVDSGRVINPLLDVEFEFPTDVSQQM